ncbi:hypothetical protein CCHL11_06035 [Colletotrichum chlorophyti]|uniref:Zn(2)-C6 fungal-type domain-containing protein n=1 Tax=Colletotrichum chlorophyti TaxID=708187 RepID=A0A1Q8RWH1_9PEZI|nr:hypothetical protein CCHL11_06035 [Colletotrichum chlorophyti]
MSSTTRAAPPSTSSAPKEPERRRCWECLRRRLVCDAVRPVCNKCRVSGIVCPGYDDKKPLTWLTPGKVTCRTRRKVRAPADEDQKKGVTTNGKERTRRAIPRNKDVMQGAECVFHSELRTDVCDIYEAVQYYNAVFYPHTSSGHASNQNVFIDQIPLKVVKFLPTAMAHNLVAIVFQHRMSVTTQWKIDCPSAKHAEARLHHHRGLAIRALNEDIANEKTQCSDVVLTGTILLLQSEIQSCLSPNWRQHVSGLLAMFTYRGGVTGWFKEAPYLRGMLLSFLITAVTANTTSPPANQITLCSHEELKQLTADLYPLGLHPSIPCPLSLWMEIIKINHLREEMAKGFIDRDVARALAADILRRIEAFDPEADARFYELEEHNDMILPMFQSALAVFCISSLQAVGALPNTHRLAVLRTVHSGRLFALLTEAGSNDIVKKSIIWPLVVAGVEAGSRVDQRQLVERLIKEQSRDAGTPLSLHTLSVLRRFWDGEITDWDTCFDRPYALIS